MNKLLQKCQSYNGIHHVTPNIVSIAKPPRYKTVVRFTKHIGQSKNAKIVLRLVENRFPQIQE
jgi:hypothetical protein